MRYRRILRTAPASALHRVAAGWVFWRELPQVVDCCLQCVHEVVEVGL